LDEVLPSLLPDYDIILGRGSFVRDVVVGSSDNLGGDLGDFCTNEFGML